MGATPILTPLNDLSIAVGPLQLVSSAGVKSPITTPTVTGFLATTELPDATAAHVSLQADLTYIGGANGYDAGWWLFQLDASVLTKALLDTHFAASGVAYLIVKRDNDVRCVTRMTYQQARRTVML